MNTKLRAEHRHKGLYMTLRVLHPSSLAIHAKISNLPTIFLTQPTVLVASSIEDEMVLSLMTQ
jgi:hypothetical protein